MTTDGRIFITDGIWNNVSYHVPWIRQKAMELHEDLDNCGSGGGGGGTGIKCTPMIFVCETTPKSRNVRYSFS